MVHGSSCAATTRSDSSFFFLSSIHEIYHSVLCFSMTCMYSNIIQNGASVYPNWREKNFRRYDDRG